MVSSPHSWASGSTKLDPGTTGYHDLSDGIALHSLRLFSIYVGAFRPWCAVPHLYHSPTPLPPVTRTFPTSCGMDDCELFRDQLATTYPRYGHALWNPSPTRSDRPVEVGDVGFIRWGTFHRLFNALLPADDSSHELGLPEGYKPLAPSLTNHINRRPFRCGHYCSDKICVESVPDYHDRYLPSASDVFIVLTSFSPNDFPKLSFLRPGKQKGAVLYLPVDTRREDTIAQGDFGKWMIEHIDSSFNFARRLGLGIEQMEQIILVTGCDRATSWINVAFLGNHDNARVSFGVRITDPDGPNTTINFQLQPGNVQGAVLNHGPQGTVR